MTETGAKIKIANNCVHLLPSALKSENVANPAIMNAKI